MKIIINGLLLSITFFAIFYLLGSFCNTSFNIKLWGPESRSLVGFLGGAAAILLGLAYIDTQKNKY